MPKDECFAPMLTVRVKDVRLGGFQKPIVGVAQIDLRDRLPWSSTYKPPKEARIGKHLDHAQGERGGAQKRLGGWGLMLGCIWVCVQL